LFIQSFCATWNVPYSTSNRIAYLPTTYQVDPTSPHLAMSTVSVGASVSLRPILTISTYL
jgi:hypothetical protein